VIVDNSIKQLFTQKLLAYAKSYVVGDPLNLDHNVGAIANIAQLKVIEAKVQQAIEEGATLSLGGQQLLTESGGYY
jgi:acyl-CoA reductase-like NAD-dependent aldehyde dehydrogenase